MTYLRYLFPFPLRPIVTHIGVPLSITYHNLSVRATALLDTSVSVNVLPIMRLATEAGVQAPDAFSKQYLLLIGGASLMATIEQSPDGATFAQNTLSVLIDASLSKAIVEQSLQSGKMGELKNPLAVALRNTFIKVMGSAISNSFKSLHAYRA